MEGRVVWTTALDPLNILLTSFILGDCKNNKKCKIGRGTKVMKWKEVVILSAGAVLGLHVNYL